MIFLPDDPSGLELTRLVTARGSILLAEFVAILMVLELLLFVFRVCLLYCLVCSLQPCCHLLGKD